MFWWKEIAVLKQQLNDLQAELQKEQGKAARLAGFVSRLQAFGVSPIGQVPRREFAEALMDSIHALLGAEQVMILRAEAETPDLLPVAGRGFTPETLSRLRVRPGEGTLGRAAQGAKTITAAASTGETESFLSAPLVLLRAVD